MLDEFLNVAYQATTRKQAEFEMVGLLKDIPTLELKKIASGTPIAELYPHLEKSASYDEAKCSSPDGPPATFLDRFKGTPLFDQALALEEEELQAEMQDQQERQKRRAESVNSDTLWDARDRIRLKKRLLELQLVKQQNGGAPEAPAQGAGAPGDVPAEGVQDSSQGLQGGVAKVSSAVDQRALELLQWADGMGRSLARSDMEKAAAARRASELGAAAGEAMAKIAINLGALEGMAGKAAPMLQKAVGFAAKHPAPLAGAAIGAAGGAMAGGPDHRLSGALGGAALGAGAGHVAAGGGGALGQQVRSGVSAGVNKVRSAFGGLGSPKAPGA